MYEFKTRQEQIDNSIQFVLGDRPEQIKSLGNRPSRVQAAILRMVIDWTDLGGYHFRVLRAAQRQYSDEYGFITPEEPPYTWEQLNA